MICEEGTVVAKMDWKLMLLLEGNCWLSLKRKVAVLLEVERWLPSMVKEMIESILQMFGVAESHR